MDVLQDYLVLFLVICVYVSCRSVQYSALDMLVVPGLSMEGVYGILGGQYYKEEEQWLKM